MKNYKKITIITILVIILLTIAEIVTWKFLKSEGTNNKTNINPEYILENNEISNFDLFFLKNANNQMNKVYSPLAIKYLLNILSLGADGTTKNQITELLGDYVIKKYENTKNISLANGIFIKNDFKNSINNKFINDVKNMYNADVIFNDYKDLDEINKWLSNNSLNLIDEVTEINKEYDMLIANILAINMEWTNKIREEKEDYYIIFNHEDYNLLIPRLEDTGYYELDFENFDKAKSLKIGAVINKYDIINEIGEENIRKTVTEAYNKWVIENPNEAEEDFNEYLEQYIKDISNNYNHVSSSTDFYFNITEEEKVFAKDLKTYNGTTLQYIGIMPKNINLDKYLNNINPTRINEIIDNLKTIELNNFKDGVITEIVGTIPMFKFEYELDLIDDFKSLGLENLFNPKKVDLSNMCDEQITIGDIKHKTNIEFANEGITAASSITVFGYGDTTSGFDYIYDVPVEKIDLTFDKPYLFMIVDKDSKEVWYMGTVYEPTKFEGNKYMYEDE